MVHWFLESCPFKTSAWSDKPHQSLTLSMRQNVTSTYVIAMRRESVTTRVLVIKSKAEETVGISFLSKLSMWYWWHWRTKDSTSSLDVIVLCIILQTWQLHLILHTIPSEYIVIGGRPGRSNDNNKNGLVKLRCERRCLQVQLFACQTANRFWCNSPEFSHPDSIL
jgi:hypothetical protein